MPLSEGGASRATLGGLESLASSGTAASSLPSVTAAAAMEEEDEVETQRALGELREDKKVGASVIGWVAVDGGKQMLSAYGTSLLRTQHMRVGSQEREVRCWSSVFVPGGLSQASTVRCSRCQRRCRHRRKNNR